MKIEAAHRLVAGQQMVVAESLKNYVKRLK